MSISQTIFFDYISSNPSNLSLMSFRNHEPKKNFIFQTESIPHNLSFIANQLLEECPICLCKKKRPIIIYNCQHIFCYKCIKQWTKINNICPLCKSNIINLNSFNN